MVFHISSFCLVVVFFLIIPFSSGSSSKLICCNISYLSITSLFIYSYLVFCIRTCKTFAPVNYIVFLVFICHAALLICVGWSGFCVYCAGKVRFLPQWWFRFWEVSYSKKKKFCNKDLLQRQALCKSSLFIDLVHSWISSNDSVHFTN